jgi:hypothetical protein
MAMASNIKFERVKETLYDSDLQSSWSKCANYATCQCLCWGQASKITSERVTIRDCEGCSMVEHSMDIDNVKDVQLNETCGLCMCFCGRGNIRIYGSDADQKGPFFTVKNVEKAGGVFNKLAEVTQKINDLKFGIARPGENTNSCFFWRNG